MVKCKYCGETVYGWQSVTSDKFTGLEWPCFNCGGITRTPKKQEESKMQVIEISKEVVESIGKILSEQGPAELKPVPNQYGVLIKFADQKESQMMFFDRPVRIAWDLLTGKISLLTDDDKCVFVAHSNLVDYCQIMNSTPVINSLTKKTNERYD